MFFSLPIRDSQETAKQIASLDICFEVDVKRKKFVFANYSTLHWYFLKAPFPQLSWWASKVNFLNVFGVKL